jgi:hypothetical protein
MKQAPAQSSIDEQLRATLRAGLNQQCIPTAPTAKRNYTHNNDYL